RGGRQGRANDRQATVRYNFLDRSTVARLQQSQVLAPRRRPMSEDAEFRDLIRRVRAGEEAAAFELVRQYEPEIRRAVRIRLNDPHMHRVLDSMDICQSVLANFFTRAAAGQFDLEQPAQLLKLLVT